jgi:hypothetical protein
MQIVTLPNATEYHNLYTLTGYPAGSSLLITNNTSDILFVVSSVVKPAADVLVYPVESGSTTMALGHADAIWIKGEPGLIVVQSIDGAITPSGFIDPRVYVGTQAFTVQSFVEANCKNGSQFEFTTYNSLVTAGQTRDFVVTTGAKPVLLKNRIFTFTGSELTTTIYRSPTFSGGTIVPYYNLSDINPMVGGVTIRATPTITAVGTQVGSSFTLLGNIPQTGQAIITTQAENNVPGLERVLRPNTTYLFRTVNTGTDTKIFSKSTWYEGDLSSTAF